MSGQPDNPGVGMLPFSMGEVPTRLVRPHPAEAALFFSDTAIELREQEFPPSRNSNKGTTLETPTQWACRDLLALENGWRLLL